MEHAMKRGWRANRCFFMIALVCVLVFVVMAVSSWPTVQEEVDVLVVITSSRLRESAMRRAAIRSGWLKLSTGGSMCVI